MGLLNKLERIVNDLFPRWERLNDTERGGTIYVLRTTTGDYIVGDEWDGSWSWVLLDPTSGAPIDLGAKLLSLEEAKLSAEKNLRGDSILTP